MKTKTQDGREWQCTCEPCYNCRVNSSPEFDRSSLKEADERRSKEPVEAAKQYREKLMTGDYNEADVRKVINEAYERVKPELKQLAAYDRGEIDIKKVDIKSLADGDPMERLVCDSCQ